MLSLLRDMMRVRKEQQEFVLKDTDSQFFNLGLTYGTVYVSNLQVLSLWDGMKDEITGKKSNNPYELTRQEQPFFNQGLDVAIEVANEFMKIWKI